MCVRIVRFLVLVCFFAAEVNAVGLLVYTPPKTGAPMARIGGGTRALGMSIPQIQVLAPQQLALTTLAQPVLYWYLTEPNKLPVEISLIRQNSEQTLLKKQLPAGLKPGLQQIQLSNEAVNLQVGESYHWSVAMIGENSLSRTNMTKAILRYEVPEIDLKSVEQKAASGYWYDALHMLIEQHSPMANELLVQIGLQLPNLE